MKNIVYFVFAMVAFSSTAALADGWNCTTTTVQSEKNRDVNVRIRNHATPEHGTRNVASIVVSDPWAKSGNRTIMTFENNIRDYVSTVYSNGTHYEANVDSRYKGAKNAKYVLGTRVNALSTAHFDIAFSYDAPVADGTIVGGKITLVKDNGGTVVRFMDCTRVLKN
jgi:hypothetical protein